jgi:hypothetical protein
MFTRVELVSTSTGAGDPSPATALVAISILCSILNHKMVGFEASSIVTQVRDLFALQEAFELLSASCIHQSKVMNVELGSTASYFAFDPIRSCLPYSESL